MIKVNFIGFSTQANWMGRNSYDYWINYKQPEEEENIKNLLFHSPVYNRTKCILLEKNLYIWESAVV